ncbi:MAG: hypothetical protein P4L50_14810 [Anaerolineaceae bacterium]|nr:hypothetical protein [Anaerolineaceae bacterium]
MEKRKLILVIAGVLLAATLPYWFAAISGGNSYVFQGFLLNPTDGNSYLAKMYQGWSGSWKFVLPYSAHPGDGAYLFLFYLFLGHVARWFNLSLILTFHAARILAGLFLLIELNEFYKYIFESNPKLAGRAFLLSAIGSGLGWLVFISGTLTSDFWVAEAYPFLSIFANPHFPLALGMILAIFLVEARGTGIARLAILFFLGLFISILLPFGLVIAALVLFVLTVWDWISQNKLVWQPFVFSLIGGGSFLIYQYWIILSDPILANWNAQNNTPAPALWDLILSFAPAIFFSIIGVYLLSRDHKSARGARILIAWFVLALVAIYFPFNLQRRFMLGFYIPTIALAVMAIDKINLSWPKTQRWLWVSVLILSIPTNLTLLLAENFGIQAHDPILYVSRSEQQALEWVVKTTPSKDLILASPEMGLFIPSTTGRRVVYGHPFETVNALNEKKNLINFFDGSLSIQESDQYLKSEGVNFVFFGPREQKLGSPVDLNHLNLVYQKGTVSIYATDTLK